jgi:DNA-binding transcriptional MerR regulator
MTEEPRLLIGEVARRSGVSTRMLRHYDRVGVVSPSERTPGGYRAYSPDDLARLFRAEALRSLGLPLGDVRAALDEGPSGHGRLSPLSLLDRLVQRSAERLANEAELLRRLRGVRDAGPQRWEEVLSLVALLRRLGSAEASERQRAALDETPPPPAALTSALVAETDPNARGAMLWALARSGDGDAVEALTASMANAADSVRYRLAVDLARLASAGPGDSASDSPVAAAALRALRHLLEDCDAAVRGRAALGLGRRGDDSGVRELVAMVGRGEDDVDAAEALGQIARCTGDADRIALLLADGLAHAEPAERRRIAQALAELPGDGAERTLEALTTDPEVPVRLTARYVLSRHVGAVEGSVSAT